MAINLTLKNIPDDVYRKLKESAELNRRSLNSEAIYRLEASLGVMLASTEERAARARRMRERLSDRRFVHEEFDELKRAGRP